MKITILKVGELKYREYQSMGEYLLTRLARLININLKFIKSKNGKEQSKTELTQLFAEPRNYIIVLDEKGIELDSKGFAKKISKCIDQGSVKETVFVIGGPYGLDADFKSKADFVWSLSHLTYSSDLAWLLVIEQLYRAFSIIKGTPYHHE